MGAKKKSDKTVYQQQVRREKQKVIHGSILKSRFHMKFIFKKQHFRNSTNLFQLR